MVTLKSQLLGFIRSQKGVTWKQIRQEHQFISFPNSELLNVLAILIQEGIIEHKSGRYKCEKQLSLF